MKSLAASNRHLATAASRKAGVERNVRSSSAIEGVSTSLFRSAATGRFVERTAMGKSTVVKQGGKKK